MARVRVDFAHAVPDMIHPRHFAKAIAKYEALGYRFDFDAQEASRLYHDAEKCGKGWVGFRGKCKRSKSVKGMSRAEKKAWVAEMKAANTKEDRLKLANKIRAERGLKPIEDVNLSRKAKSAMPPAQKALPPGKPAPKALPPGKTIPPRPAPKPEPPKALPPAATPKALPPAKDPDKIPPKTTERQQQPEPEQKPPAKPIPPKGTPKPPHANPKTHTDFIENGAAIASDFLGQIEGLAKEFKAADEAYRGVQAEALDKLKAEPGKVQGLYDKLRETKRYKGMSQKIKDTYQQEGKAAEAAFKAGASPKEAKAMLAAAREKRDEAIQRYKAEMSAVVSRELERQMNNDPKVKAARAAVDKLAAPAKRLTSQLIQTSKLSQKEADAMVAKVNLPPNHAKSDPGMTKIMASTFRLLNGNVQGIQRVKHDPARAAASRSGRHLQYTPGDYKNLVHEMSHFIEYENEGVAEAAMDWVKSRSSSDKPVPLKQLAKGNYSDDEVAYPDEFLAPYVGKSYEARGGALSTEVISMGVEHFQDPVRLTRFAMQDPDHFALVLGVMRK